MKYLNGKNFHGYKSDVQILMTLHKNSKDVIYRNIKGILNFICDHESFHILKVTLIKTSNAGGIMIFNSSSSKIMHQNSSVLQQNQRG